MNSFLRCSLFSFSALLYCDLNAQQTDTISKKQKTVESVDFKSNKTVRITYSNGTNETMSETEATKKGLIHNGGYGNQPTVNTPTGNRKSVHVKSFGSQPLYVLDGKEIAEEEMMAINPSTIESINVLKDKNATDKYGVKGKRGVVEIVLKQSKLTFDDPSIDYSSSAILRKLINAEQTDVIESFTISRQDEMENIIKIDVVGQAFTDQVRKFLTSLKTGDSFIVEKIFVKRNGVLTKLPAVVHNL